MAIGIEEGPGDGKLNDLMKLKVPFMAPLFFVFDVCYFSFFPFPSLETHFLVLAELFEKDIGIRTR